MFWNLILITYFASMVSGWLVLYLISKKLTKKFREKHPEWKSNKTKEENILALIKLFVLFAMPILNTLLVFVMLFDEENLSKKTLEKMELQYNEDAENAAGGIV